MELKQPFRRVGALGLAAAAAGLIGSLALASPAQAEDTTIHLKDQHRNQTADQFEEGCGEDEHIPADKPAGYDGWVFNYPGSSQYGTEILVLTAEFLDEEGETHVLTTDTDGFTINDTGTLKAYIGAPAGWTLVDAEAQLAGADHTWKPTFVVTHTCPGEPGGEESTPSENPTSPGENPTSPGEEATTPGDGGSSVPGEESTSPAANLPTTGTPLTIAIVSAAVLAAAGAALFMIQRRRREAQDW